MGIKQSDGRFHHAGAICHFPFCMYAGIRTATCCLRCGINPFRACPYADNQSVGEPNTPLAFWRRDACHSKQQAGHVKIVVGFGQSTKDSISRIADYGTCILLIVPQKKVRTLIKLLFRGTVALGAKVHQKIAIAT